MNFLFFTFLLIHASQQSGDVGYVLHLTDLHWDPFYEVGSYAQCLRQDVGLPCCHKWEIPDPFFGARIAGQFGDYNCDTPMSLLQAIFTQLKLKLLPKYQFDFVIWTGDDPNHSDLTQSPEQNLHAIQTLTNLFFQYMNGTQVWPSLGNHDTWPVDQLADPPESSWLLDKLAKWWTPWIGNDPEALTSLKKGGFYTTLIKPKVRIISLNTLFFDSHNKLSSPDPAGQLKWLESTLQKAQQNNEIVWLIGHICPGDSEATDLYSLRYNQLITRYNKTVRAQFFGHTHHDQFTFTNSNLDVFVPTPSSMIYITPSITPQSVNNPAVRIFQYNRTSFEILDSITYHVNLTQANQNGKISLDFLYSSKQTFNLPDLSMKSWLSLLSSLQTNSSVYQRYISLYYGNVSPQEWETCDFMSACFTEKICEIMFTTSQQFQNCTQFLYQTKNFERK